MLSAILCEYHAIRLLAALADAIAAVCAATFQTLLHIVSIEYDALNYIYIEFLCLVLFFRFIPTTYSSPPPPPPIL